jgi:hypothetical protein
MCALQTIETCGLAGQGPIMSICDQDNIKSYLHRPVRIVYKPSRYNDSSGVMEKVMRC